MESNLPNPLFTILSLEKGCKCSVQAVEIRVTTELQMGTSGKASLFILVLLVILGSCFSWNRVSEDPATTHTTGRDCLPASFDQREEEAGQALFESDTLISQMFVDFLLKLFGGRGVLQKVTGCK